MKVFPTLRASRFRCSRVGESEFSCCSSVEQVSFLQNDKSRFRGCGVGESPICYIFLRFSCKKEAFPRCEFLRASHAKCKSFQKYDELCSILDPHP